MQKTYNAPLKMWALDCDNNHILHKIGSDDYSIRRHMMVRPEDVDLYEEVALEDIPPYTEAEYKAKVSELIHERYSIDDEIALAANASSPMLLDDEERAAEVAAEYAAYQAYRQECKTRAKELLITRKGGKEVQDGTV